MTNVSNPAAFGVEWTAGETGNTYQLVNPRGTKSLLFGVRPKDKTEWITQSVVAPEHFGLDKPPRTYREFERIAQAYVG